MTSSSHSAVSVVRWVYKWRDEPTLEKLCTVFMDEDMSTIKVSTVNCHVSVFDSILHVCTWGFGGGSGLLLSVPSKNKTVLPNYYNMLQSSIVHCSLGSLDAHLQGVCVKFWLLYEAFSRNLNPWKKNPISLKSVFFDIDCFILPMLSGVWWFNNLQGQRWALWKVAAAAVYLHESL